MSLRKQLFFVEQQYKIFASAFDSLSVKVDALIDKLNRKKVVTFKSRLIAVRNWLILVLECIIIVLLLSSCFVTGRTIHVMTPKIDITADTATAYTWPYNTKFQ